MIRIKLNDKEYPYKLTIAACKELKQKIGKDYLQMKFDDTEEIKWMLFYGIKYGMKISGEQDYLEASELDELDLPELLQAISQINPENKDPK